jgi:hypothetical protein
LFGKACFYAYPLSRLVNFVTTATSAKIDCRDRHLFTPVFDPHGAAHITVNDPQPHVFTLKSHAPAFSCSIAVPAH